MISTPFCTGTGFVKCVDTTREEADVSVGLDVVAAAIFVMDMEEVFVARMAWEGQMVASSLKILVLREGISGTASMTMSTSDKALISREGVMSPFIVSASDWESFSFWTSFDRSLLAKAMPLSRED